MKKTKLNFLPDQYKATNKLKINHNYLFDQFKNSDAIFNDIKKLVNNGDFTLGKAVDEFENSFKKLSKIKYAIGVGSGTDAIFLSLKALGVKEGDEVITTAHTFYATIGAIVTAGAKPVFVDVGYDFNIDPKKIEEKITSKTKAIVPVHWSGLICDMDSISKIAKKHNLFIVEDACHAINASRNNFMSGAFSDTACYSMHPLKNLNVWGDAGIITTNSEQLYRKLSLMRNHGLIDRDTCEIFGYNSRLDSIQAIVGSHLLNNINHITDSRINNALYFDNQLSKIEHIRLPIRPLNTKQVFHLYIIMVEQRDQLIEYLISKGIDAKIHYPLPMHLQPAAKEYNYKKGDFPITEKIAETAVSLPVHEFIKEDERRFVVEQIKNFYK